MHKSRTVVDWLWRVFEDFAQSSGFDDGLTKFIFGGNSSLFFLLNDGDGVFQRLLFSGQNIQEAIYVGR